MKSIEVKNLTKIFELSKKDSYQSGCNKLYAVKNLNFSLNEGEIFALLGPNGAGKTTTLRMLSTMIRPTSGEILIDDKDIYLDLNKNKKRICFLTSELRFDEFFTPDYAYNYMASLYGISKENIEKTKEKIFSRFNINEFKDRKISELSTGMKQKVSIAISLAHNPDIIIFDEPTNGLDIIVANDVENFLLELKNEGKTIIISTHIFSLVEKICDRVAIIFDGELQNIYSIKEIKDHNHSLEEVFFKLYKDKK